MEKHTFEIDPWHLSTTDLAPDKQQLRSKLLTSSNGYLTRRAFLATDATQTTRAVNYANGLLSVDSVDNKPQLLALPDFGTVALTVNQTQVSLQPDKVSDFKLDFDLKNGVVTQSFTYQDPQAKLSIATQYFLSQVNPHCGAFQTKVTLITGEAEVTLSCELRGNEAFTLQDKGQNAAGQLYLQGQTKDQAFSVLLASALASEADFTADLTQDADHIGQRYQGTLTNTAAVTFTRWVAVATGSVDQVAQIQQTASQQVAKISSQAFADLVLAEKAAWGVFWDNADCVIEGDRPAQQGIRYNLAQLFMHRPLVNLNSWSADGASRLNGAGRGTWASGFAAGNAFLGLLTDFKPSKYVLDLYEQLPRAKKRAGQLGLKGAFYPLTQIAGHNLPQGFPLGSESIYTSALVAYRLRNYMNYFSDRTFMQHQGLEILVALARFYASRVDYLPEVKGYTFLAVSGPNQFEINSNNNWFINTMAHWTLDYVLQMTKSLSPAGLAGLQLKDQELSRWALLKDNLQLPTPDAESVLPQSDSYRPKLHHDYSAILPVAGLSKDRYQRLPYVQQAEVLLGLLLLGDDFDKPVLLANYNYYDSLTLHRSQTSESIHAILAAQLDKKVTTTDIFKRQLRFDLDDTDPTQLHLDTMAASWLTLAHGLARIQVTNGQLSLRPFCPRDWQRYSFHFNFQGRLLEITVTAEVTEVQLLRGIPLTIQLDGHGVIIE